MQDRFVPFGRDHVAALILTLAVPALPAWTARLRPALDAPFRRAFAGLLIAAWIAWYALFIARGWLGPGNALPMNLCDWAAMPPSSPASST